MWKIVEKIVYYALGLKINFVVLEILLGIPFKKYTPYHVLNSLILFTKQFIYTQKRQSNAMFRTILLRALSRKCEMEI